MVVQIHTQLIIYNKQEEWKKKYMDTNTQQLIIIILGAIAITSILTGNNTLIEIIVAGLIGFLGQKTMTDKQNEIINKTIKENVEEEEDVQ